MKATPLQRRIFRECADRFIAAYNHPVTNMRDAWCIFQMSLLQMANGDDNPNVRKRVIPQIPRPIRYGTHRDWLFQGLSDKNVETMMRAELKIPR